MSTDKEYKYIDELVITYLSEGLEKEDLDKLLSWVEESSEHKEYFMQRREVWFSMVSADDKKRFDYEKAFELFLSKISQKEEKRTIPLQKRWLQYAAVAVLFIAMAVSMYHLGNGQLKNRFEDIIVEAPLGSKTKLYLPDGSLVWLNAGSKIVYSQGFGVNTRVVDLEGEAYFEVVKNEKLAFMVKTPNLDVKVLGTKFNFHNYPEDEELYVSLIEGKIGLVGKSLKEEYVLQPAQKAVMNKKSGTLKVLTDETEKSSLWTQGRLYFDEMLLPDIARELERSYNVKIIFANEELRALRFYANIERNESSIQDVMEMLCSSNKLIYTLENRTITLHSILK